MSPFAWEWWRFAWSLNAGTLEMRGWRQLWGRLYWREHGPYDRTFMDKLFGDWWLERAAEWLAAYIGVPVLKGLEFVLVPLFTVGEFLWKVVATLVILAFGLVAIVAALVLQYAPIWGSVVLALVVAKHMGVF